MTVVDRLGVNSDPNNADVWGAVAGESEGADVLWTFDLQRFKSMLKAALATEARTRGFLLDRDRNLLAGETSPYLLQHAGNPVHWRPWGEAALEEAKARDCPILLSIGYAACHWCHVMAHELFENPETAQLMNRLFVNVKVDREERPDVDHIYMTALHALGQQGGWPLTMFLIPGRQADDRGHLLAARAALRAARRSGKCCASVDTAWRDQRATMEERGVTLADHLAKLSAPDTGAGELAPGDLTRVGDALLSAVDQARGRLERRAKISQRAGVPLLLERVVPPRRPRLWRRPSGGCSRR